MLRYGESDLKLCRTGFAPTDVDVHNPILQEKLDFLEEHVEQLVGEVKKKNKIIQEHIYNHSIQILGWSAASATAVSVIHLFCLLFH